MLGSADDGVLGRWQIAHDDFHNVHLSEDLPDGTIGQHRFPD